MPKKRSPLFSTLSLGPLNTYARAREKTHVSLVFSITFPTCASPSNLLTPLSSASKDQAKTSRAISLAYARVESQGTNLFGLTVGAGRGRKNRRPLLLPASADFKNLSALAAANGCFEPRNVDSWLYFGPVDHPHQNAFFERFQRAGVKSHHGSLANYAAQLRLLHNWPKLNGRHHA